MIGITNSSLEGINIHRLIERDTEASISRARNGDIVCLITSYQGSLVANAQRSIHLQQCAGCGDISEGRVKFASSEKLHTKEQAGSRSAVRHK